MLKCWNPSIALGFFISFLWLVSLMWKGVSNFSTYCVFQSRHLWYILNFYFVWVLANVVVAIICRHEKHRDVLHWVYFRLVAFYLTFRSFWSSLIVFLPIICLNDVFLRKAMTGVALDTFPNVLLIFNICHCLLMISLIFGKAVLYVTGNGTAFFRTASVLFNTIYLAKLSTLSIWFGIMFCFYPFSTDRLTKTLECFLFSLKVEQTRFILDAWLQWILFFSERGCAQFV